MRDAAITLLSSCVATVAMYGFPDPEEAQKPNPSPANKSSPAAEVTRTKYLTVMVMATFQDVRLGDILKELAAQVEMKSDRALMWTYGAGFPFEKRVSFTINNQSLETALDRLFTQVGDETGYVIVSRPGDKHDGWVRLTNQGERGTELRPATKQEETAASEQLVLARKFFDSGMFDSAKPLLEILVRKYPTTKPGKEARVLLRSIDK